MIKSKIFLFIGHIDILCDIMRKDYLNLFMDGYFTCVGQEPVTNCLSLNEIIKKE